jgi:HPt (histidine-containing phosphotransfer) domain-containing protein
MSEQIPPSAPDGEILDFGQLEEMRGMPGRHSASLLTEFVALFMREEPARIAELRRLAGIGQWSELKRLAHSLAGSCAMLGAIEMQRAALKLQAAAGSGRPAEVALRLEGVEAAWKRVQETLARHGLLPK